MSINKEHLSRRTKIIATLGPKTDDPDVLAQIIAEGVDLVRINLSHGTHESHQARLKAVREASKKQGRVIGLLADLQGPKIRISSFKTGEIRLSVGDTFTLDAELGKEQGDQHAVGIDYKDLPNDVSAGDVLLLDDGRLTLIVESVKGSKIICAVKVGGELSNHKGINRQGGGLSAASLTEKDIKDLKFLLRENVDYVALSFPRNADDVLRTKALIKAENGTTALIAKIERAEAVEHIDAIIEASDGVMVARGDLAVEIGDAEVPLVQKDIIHRARALDKPVIIATQMMESMIQNTVPTRAEVSDVANAVLDNADAVMLSAETAVGKYPAMAVAAMARTCVVAERQPRSHISRHRVECQFQRIDEAIAMATMYTANHLDIQAIVTLTESGATPLWMSRIRTAIPIYGLSRYARSLGKMTLYRGVYPIEFDPTKCSATDVNREALMAMKAQKLLKDGDMVVLTKGDFMGVGGGSNAMRILVVGQVAKD